MKLNIEQGIKQLKLEKKYNKFKKDPERFVQDMIRKRTQQVQKYLPTPKYQGKNKFTIISACFNVSKYLDEYFESIISQSLEFRKHIFIICVDDGSTDETAQIIRKWQKKYPKNIRYIYKENAGQASARNLALEYVKTDWVTFIDPDDLLSHHYFQKIDQFLVKNLTIDMISMPIATYYESSHTFHYDRFPLSFCYKQDGEIIDTSNMKEKIHLSVCNNIFRYQIIKNNTIIFNNNIKPNFEDGSFDLEFLSYAKKVAYLKGEYYFYRIRQDNSSTTNNQWQKKEKYDDVLQYGFLNLFIQYANQQKVVPINIQRTFLYFAIQYLKNIIENPQMINFLTNEEKIKFYNIFCECFKYIEQNSIMNFHLLGCDYRYKFAMISGIKKESVNLSVVYVDKIDVEHNKIILSFFGNQDDLLEINIEEQLIIPTYVKNYPTKFIENTIYHTKKMIINLPSYGDKLTIKKNYSKVIIKYNNREFGSTLSIKNDFNININKKNIVLEDNSIWLFMDRDNLADDNAEHFYRFIKNNNLHKKIYFSLRKNSKDWERLQKDEFNLLEFGSHEFNDIFKCSTHILSSQADKYLLEYDGVNSLDGKKFIFLQHGVIATNIAQWLNSIKKIDLFITSTVDEYQWIAGEDSPYIYTPSEVKLTGLARHDTLLSRSQNEQSKRIITVMPTWRSNVVGKLKKDSAERELQLDFCESLYFKSWYNFFHSIELLKLCREFNYTVEFIPHPNIMKYISFFNLPNYIDTPNTNYFSYQDIIVNSGLLITDYSSIAFDFAFLNKPTIYYLFDDETQHSSKKGIFDYRIDGFGPVVTSNFELFNSLSILLNNHCVVDKPYLENINKIFPFRDGKNCERIYQEIIKLNYAKEKNIDFSILKKIIDTTECMGDWDLVKIRSFYLIEYGVQEDHLYAMRQIAKASLHLNNSFIDEQFIENNINTLDLAIIKKYYTKQWQSCIELLDTKISDLMLEEKFWYVQCHAWLHSGSTVALECVNELSSLTELTAIQHKMLRIWSAQIQSNHELVINILLDLIDSTDIDTNIYWQAYQPYLILAQTYHVLQEIEQEKIWLNRHYAKFKKDVYFYQNKLNNTNTI